MKRTIKLFLLLSGIFALWYCSPKVLPPTSSELNQLKQSNPAVDTSNIARGYDLFARNCNKCHGLKNPANFTIEQWNSILPKMAKRTKLTPDEVELVHTYVTTFSKKI
jgi:mono/diheme cytochrome c family protein